VANQKYPFSGQKPLALSQTSEISRKRKTAFELSFYFKIKPIIQTQTFLTNPEMAHILPY
jgi:hypothetical protein